MDGTAAVGTTTKYAREDHVHPSDTSRAAVTYVDAQVALKANIASPTFTGDPKAPTPAPGDNDTSVATTAFVTAAIAAGGGGATVTIADTPPGSPTNGSLWWESDTGNSYISYNDGTSTQWVPLNLGVPGPPGPPGAAGGVTPAALTKADDTNVTLTLGGTPATAVLAATSITAGWAGTLATARGGLGANNSAATGVPIFAAGTATVTAQAALTRTNDTNVTVTLGGAPNTALLAATSLTLGWTGTLATGRGGLGIDASASNGVPLFTTGAVAMTGTTGTGNFVRAADPVFTGNPTAPTQAPGDNDLSIATTAFVTAAITASGAPAPATATPLVDGTAAVGVATKYAREDHKHPLSYTASALTKTDDTNVTLTLGGTPTTALLQAASVTAGWTGTLSTTRGGLGANNGAANGVPLFAAGAVTMTATTGTGNIARDSSVPLAATATPIMDGTAAIGTGTKYAKEDHVHPKSWTQLTQAAYDALTPPNANMLYVIVG
jgi:hypothetical protein